MDKKISELATLLSQGATLNGDSLVPMTVELPLGGGLKTVRVKFSELMTALGYIPLQGTDVDNPVTGNIEYQSQAFEDYTIDKGFYQVIDGYGGGFTHLSDLGSSIPVIWYISPMYSAVLKMSQDVISIDATSPAFKGISVSSYFGENYDDNTYVQKKYVDVAMTPLDYGDIIAVGGIENVQVYTTGSGTGIASVDLLPIIPIGKDVTVSDLANNAGTHNIQIDSGSGNTILYNGAASQDITLSTNGASVTIRKMTSTKFMVI